MEENLTGKQETIQKSEDNRKKQAQPGVPDGPYRASAAGSQGGGRRGPGGPGGGGPAAGGSGKSLQYFLRIIGYFRPYIVPLVIIVLLHLGVALCNMIYPYLNGTVLYDRVLAKNEQITAFLRLPAGAFATALLVVIVTMVLTKLFSLILQAAHDYLNAKIVPLVVLELEKQVFQSMGELSLRFFYSSRTGGLMTRVLSDAGEVTSFFVDYLPEILTQVPSLAATCVIMFVMDWRLALVSLCLLPLIIFLHAAMMTTGHVLFSRRHRAERDITAKLNDNLTGVRVVKSFGQEEREIGEFGGINSEVQKAEVAITVNFNKINAAYSFLENMTTLLVWAVGGFFVLGSEGINYGHLITFASYVTQLNPLMRLAAEASRQWTNSMNAASRVFAIIDAEPDFRESDAPVSMEEVKGEIRIEHLTFGYNKNRPVLKDINLHVEPGKMIGIVGYSGAGKTTLVNLISRLYEADKGRILIDGIDIRRFSFADLRRNVAMVSQETYIFMGTVAENIAYAKPEATREEIIRAARMASAHDFICRMPDGYDTVVGASGRTLSGGERQRISIARAILADPKILILDEATASVDTETERAIQQSIAYLKKNRTTLAIAHRLSTLKDADSLVVIDHGRVVEEGTHQELLEAGGLFAHLSELQTTALAMRGLA